MQLDENEEKLLRSVALQNARAVLLARERAERELISAKEALEAKSEELAQQREWFQVTLSSIGDAVITTDRARKITFLNPVAEKMTGWTVEDALGQPLEAVFKIINEQTREPTANPIEKVLRDGLVVALANDTALIARDGTETSIEDSAAPIKDRNGRITGVVMVFHDVTNRRRTENARRHNEEELRALADSIPQLAWMAEHDGHIFWYNRKWYEYTGTTLEQMEGWGWQTVHDPKMLPFVLDRWKESIRTGQPFEMEFPLRGADEVFRWFLTRVNPVLDREGRVVRWFGTNTDVDTVRRAQEALRDETRILELLNKTGIAIAANLDLQSLVQAVTDSATQLSGAKFGAFFYNLIDEQGESFLLYTLSGAPREAFEKFGHPRATPLFGPTFRGEGVIRCDDVSKDPRYGQMPPHHGMPTGHLPVRSYLAVPVISRSGDVLGGLFFGHPEPNIFTERTERLISGVAAQAAVAIDNARLYDAAQKEIARRKKAEESLRASESQLAAANAELDRKVQERTASLQQAITQMEEFSYSVSHDLRAPLRAIEAYSRFLKDDHSQCLNPEAEDYLAKISRNIGQMNRLINDVLTLSRMSRSEMRLHPVVLQTLIEEIIELNLHMQGPQADIEVRAPDSVLGDEVSLSQAVSNLLSNAVKFVAAGVKPRVKVWSEPRADQIRVWVEDNGIGIKPGQHEKLFGMFQRLTSDPSYEGTGIGLAIVRKAIDRMGGKVGVESNGSSGSRFWVELKKA